MFEHLGRVLGERFGIHGIIKTKVKWFNIFVWYILYAIVLFRDSIILWYFFYGAKIFDQVGTCRFVCFVEGTGFSLTPLRNGTPLFCRCLGWWYPIRECSPWRLGKMKFLVEAHIFTWLNHPLNRLGCRFCQESWLLQRFFSNALPRQKAKLSKATKADVWRVRVHIISFPNKFCHHVPLYQVLSRLMRAFCNSRYKHPDDRLSRNDSIFSLD